MKKAIQDIEDIKLLVDSFYEKVNRDSLLSPIFNDKANVNWETHLPKMYRFWSTQLLGTMDYKGQPFPPHLGHGITPLHFERWLQLFMQTVDENFEGEIAEIAKYKGLNIARIFQHKLKLTEGNL
jgi:hemoglobin